MDKKLLNLLKANQPILYEEDNEYWPYRYSGTCFPIKWNGYLYIISARHCYSNMGMEKPEQTSYPIPGDERNFFGYDNYYTIDKDFNVDRYSDLLALEVSTKLHSKEIQDRVCGIDISNEENVVIPTDNSIKDMWFRGFPLENDNHEITENKIIKQGYITNKPINVRRSSFEHCYWIKMKTPSPDNMSPNGISGSPIYAITADQSIKLCGILIAYNEITGELLSISPLVLREMLKQAISTR